MKICAAQLKSIPGAIDQNDLKHQQLIKLAAKNDIDLIFFPELSLTGYEPTLAESLFFTIDDPRLDHFQILSDEHSIIICIGLPLKLNEDLYISLLIFQPNQYRIPYSKQILHEDERPFFKEGKEQVFIEKNGFTIAPAICYESVQSSHIQHALKNKASIYLASVAKHESALQKSHFYYSEASKSNQIPILLANSHGSCDDFLSFGRSAIWDKQGQCLAQLGAEEDGLIGLDTDTGQSIIIRQ